MNHLHSLRSALAAACGTSFPQLDNPPFTELHAAGLSALDAVIIDAQFPGRLTPGEHVTGKNMGSVPDSFVDTHGEPATRFPVTTCP